MQAWVILFCSPVFTGVMASVNFPDLLIFLLFVLAPIPFFLAVGSWVGDYVPFVSAEASLYAHCFEGRALARTW